MSFAKPLALLSALLASSAIAACGGSPDAPSTTTKPASVTSTPAGDISVFPDKVFVGVDETGKALSAAPVGLTGGAGTVSWISSNTGIATASGNAKAGTIAAKKPGTSTVTVKDGTKTATVLVTVIAYTSADKTAGAAEFAAAKCADCHGASGPDITPSGVGKHSDEEILAAVTAGMNPEGGDLEGGHKYTATPAIVAYLRSIAARTDTPIKDD
jgi:mono/diheme cytochrome c family protein